MRGNSDLSSTYPFSVAPAHGWGNPNPSGEFIVVEGSLIGKAVRLDGDGGFDIVDYADATRFNTAADAAIASGRVANKYQILAA